MEQTTTQNLIRLADALTEHLGISLWRVSMRATNDGKFFGRLSGRHDPEGKGPAGCRPPTAARTLRWFIENWPDDLAWPDDLTWDCEITWSPENQKLYRERFDE